ncbi:hypothetical protein J4E90_001742 [Alternaria incomplexa]|uniref:uncharacterized protein n=1 Tax=Alternaria incomplexa TaxID=1187928 RepID=UPI00221F0783|nr:uncharacterized protein J4E90_001742 [Alternaria incomplexa]KAI4919605.1 hypothetical protein J4E90_001742 [Alternaria incomplexa]
MALEVTSMTIQTPGANIAVTTPLSPHKVSMKPLAIPPMLDSTQFHGLLDPRFISTDFDKLRFEAAAHEQLTLRNEQSNKTALRAEQPSSTLLISSPYNIPGHYLDLSSPHLTASSRLLALALTVLKPATPTYATASYTQALNFDSVLTALRELIARENFTWRETSFYVVVFRSQLKEGIDEEYLYRLDEESHREACESGGLLKYWFGKADGERRNLATCFWHSREDAYKGGLGPWHRKARAAGRELYESIVFSTYRFTVADGAEEYKFEEWVK